MSPGGCISRGAARSTTKRHSVVEPCIKAGCPANDVVLDPFVGSGTTGIVARDLGRRFVGVDVSLSYIVDIAQKRLGLKQLARWNNVAPATKNNETYDFPLFKNMTSGMSET